VASVRRLPQLGIEVREEIVDEKMLGNGVQLHNRRAIEIGHLVQTIERRDRRACARIDENLVRRE